MNDLMRFPLGILTGVGFIGAGAILRRDDIVVGVTSAATLWYVTVVGLCIGAGHSASRHCGPLSSAAARFGCWRGWKTGCAAQPRLTVSVEIDGGNLDETALRRLLEDAGLKVLRTRAAVSGPAGIGKSISDPLSSSACPANRKCRRSVKRSRARQARGQAGVEALSLLAPPHRTHGRRNIRLWLPR